MTSTAMILTAAFIAAATGGHLVSGAPERVIEGFAIDSRVLARGDLFFAIVAARDGHQFVGDALSRGAAGAVIATGSDIAVTEVHRGGPAGGAAPQDPVLIEVVETTVALQDLARAVRRESTAVVVAITGSAGKTTTKEAIAELLSGRYRVIRNRGNLNNHLGLPLSLLELRHDPDVAVMELGMNHAGEIRLLVGIAAPGVRVWTNVGDAHRGHFASPSAIADAKGEILEGASTSDLLVCNADDPQITPRVAAFPGRMVTFGLSPHADVCAEAVDDRGLDGSDVRVRTSTGTTKLHVPLLGAGNLSNVLAAVAVAVELDVPLDEIAHRVSGLQPAAHRGAVLRLARGVTIVDDSYNSSPSALQHALAVLAREGRATRKVAVLGEMLELGTHARPLHQACGRAAAASGLDRLITVGGEAARVMADAAVEAGMDAEAVTWTNTSAAASDLIVPWLAAGDVVLIKGSRGIRTDLVVERITGEFS